MTEDLCDYASGSREVKSTISKRDLSSPEFSLKNISHWINIAIFIEVETNINLLINLMHGEFREVSKLNSDKIAQKIE
jgi:hypothetical protein